MIALNGLRGVKVRLLIPWQGGWTADIDFDLAEAPVMPIGIGTLTVSNTAPPFVGFIDPTQSGIFGEKAKARVIGGIGWSKNVLARGFHNDAGVLSSAVIGATALEVGERALQAIPSRLGIDYARTGGPASRVLSGLDWYVDFSGTTVVGPRIPKPADPTSIDVLSWDPLTQTAIIASDEVITPGTVLVDTRFGTTTVVDVEQVFDDAGARATCHCRSAADAITKGSRLSTALDALIREKSGATYMALRKYRVVGFGPDGRLTLQALKLKGEFPDLIAISEWPSTAGMSCKPRPGATALVGFADGNPAQPVILHFDSTSPLETTITADTFVRVGGILATPVVLGGPLATWVTAVIAVCAAHVPPIVIPPLPPGFATTKLLAE